MAVYLVRIGFAADVFLAMPVIAEMKISRGSDVLVQTPRGVELGEVLGKSTPLAGTSAPLASASAPTLRIIRELTPDDRLLVERLQRYKRDAVRRCQDILAASESTAVLLDVDQLFDGNSLVLHFLGPVDAMGRELTDTIVAEYESQVQSIRLSELMTHGCGPGCGSESAGGCGSSGGCASCALVGACQK